MILHKKKLAGFAVLALFIFLPPALDYIFSVSSFAIGTFIACAIAYSFLPWKMPRHSLFFEPIEAKLLILFFLIGVHFAISVLLNSVNFARFLGSLIALLIMLRVSLVIIPLIYDQNPDVSVKVLFSGMVILFSISTLGIKVPGYNINGKAVFPFSEPSFFGLAIMPLLAYLFISTKSIVRYAYLVVVIATALLLQNLTMIVGVLLVLLIASRLAVISIIVGLAVVVIIFGNLDLSYYTNRLDLSSENRNFSSLVYIQGWELMAESLRNSWGWGLGFQQLGVNGTSVDSAKLIYALAGNYLNLLDGGFVASKLVSDFGVFGIIACGIYIVLGMRSVFVIRRFLFDKEKINGGDILAHSFLIMFSIDMFVRGVSYITGSVVLVMTAIIHLHCPVSSKKLTLCRLNVVEN